MFLVIKLMILEMQLTYILYWIIHVYEKCQYIDIYVDVRGRKKRSVQFVYLGFCNYVSML